MAGLELSVAEELTRAAVGFALLFGLIGAVIGVVIGVFYADWRG